MTRTTNRLPFGFRFVDRALTDGDFVGDLALVTDSMQQLIDALNVLQEEAVKVGLTVNWRKTKIIVVKPPAPVGPPEFITVFLD